MEQFEPVKIEQKHIDMIRKFIAEHKEAIEQVTANRILRDDIFPLLDNYCTVIFYPSKDSENNGFHVTYPFLKEEIHFVYINTAQYKEKQIFTAAHELGHIWALEAQITPYLSRSCDNSEYIERIMNRFAAELLMPDDIFITAANTLIDSVRDSNGRITVAKMVQVITHLMNDYFTSYKSVVYRLFELSLIPEKVGKILWGDGAIPRKTLDDYSCQVAQMQGYNRLYQPDERRWIDGLKELLDTAKKNCSAPEAWLSAFYDRFNFYQDSEPQDGLRDDLSIFEAEEERGNA